MSSNSSTSSSDRPVFRASINEAGEVVLNALERMAGPKQPGRRVLPIAAGIFLLLVIAIEVFLYTNRVWFADRAAWQWDVKKHMLADGRLKGNVAILGTSVLFHGVDPVVVNEQTKDTGLHTVNLALNGMQIHHITQMVIDQHEQGNRYDHLLLELRDFEITRDNWTGGPYWRLWASMSHLNDNAVLIHEPSLLMSLSANRLLTSYNYRRGIDNWIFASARQRRPATEYRNRNQEVGRGMIAHLGYSPLDVTRPLKPEQVPPPRERRWERNDAGLWWLDKLVAYCDEHGVTLTLLAVPAPPYVVADRQRSGYDHTMMQHVRDLQARYPNAHIRLMPVRETYDLADFTDDVHYSPTGVEKLTREVTAWVKSLPQP